MVRRPRLQTKFWDQITDVAQPGDAKPEWRRTGIVIRRDELGQAGSPALPIRLVRIEFDKASCHWDGGHLRGSEGQSDKAVHASVSILQVALAPKRLPAVGRIVSVCCAEPRWPFPSKTKEALTKEISAKETLARGTLARGTWAKEIWAKEIWNSPDRWARPSICSASVRSRAG